MEKQIVELKNENKLLSTKSVENRKRNEKEIEAYKNALVLKEKKNHKNIS